MFETMLASVRMMLSRLIILIEFRSEPSTDKKNHLITERG